ncbi:MAG: VanW family protein [Lachnospiraceae bacterium]|nr:VanW family protein [Lachnospiraceae bacterium]
MKNIKRSILCIVLALVLALSMPTGFTVRAEGELVLPQGADTEPLYLPDNTIFDPVFYATYNQDVAIALGTTRLELYKHYIKYGRREGRVYHAPYVRAQVVSEDGTMGCTEVVNANGVITRTYVNLVTGEQKVEQEAPVAFTYLSDVSTPYKTKINRAINVQTASSRINNQILQPGQEFSYSRTILPRTRENGYVEAPQIVNKEYVTGVGGGICQVSSTLYASLLDAGLPVLERHAHSLPVSYIGPGRDATISGLALDLRFANVLDRPMAIESFCTNGYITVMLIALG